MATSDLVITDGNTKPFTTTGMAESFKKIGEAVGGKMILLYWKESDSSFHKTIANDADKYKASALSWGTGAIGEDIVLVTAGIITVGAILQKGRRYVVSSTSGLLMLDEDLAIGDYPFQAGIAKSTTELIIAFSDDSDGTPIA